MDIFNLKEYAENLLHITTKETALKKFKFNHFQESVYQEIVRQKRVNNKVRIIILKARQLGISTFCSAYIFHQAITQFYRNGFIIAHDLDSARNLFNMIKRFYDYLPGIKPLRKLSNAKELLFDNPNKLNDYKPGLSSSIKLETAGKSSAGRSSTIQDLHISELPYFENAAKVLSGLLQAVPRENSSIILEGTASGVSGNGEEFYTRWKKAEGGESDFMPIFFAAHKNPEYRIPISGDFILTDWESERLKLFPEMTKEYLNFRRYKINNDLGSALISPEMEYRQEYPDTAEEAFITSGRSVFDIDKITQLIKRAGDIGYEEKDF